MLELEFLNRTEASSLFTRNCIVNNCPQNSLFEAYFAEDINCPMLYGNDEEVKAELQDNYGEIPGLSLGSVFFGEDSSRVLESR